MRLSLTFISRVNSIQPLPLFSARFLQDLFARVCSTSPPILLHNVGTRCLALARFRTGHVAGDTVASAFVSVLPEDLFLRFPPSVSFEVSNCIHQNVQLEMNNGA